MNPILEQKLWNAGKNLEAYTQETWQEIIDAILDDFQKFMGQEFHRAPEINLHIKYSHSPSFNRWIWSEEQENVPLYHTAWSAVIGGEMVGTENGEDIFHVSLTLFLFDMTSKKRLCLKTGESLLEFVFEKQSDSHGYWRSLGWCKDEWGEWEDLDYDTD
ncbi:hypothetical protein [Microcoleus sp. B9-D4]|uniref:hypothetical protein n=1 Tax=Microcoleus sp. B9-D4 TaxID=2818711 RepID=UPI002FD77CA9